MKIRRYFLKSVGLLLFAVVVGSGSAANATVKYFISPTAFNWFHSVETFSLNANFTNIQKTDLSDNLIGAAFLGNFNLNTAGATAVYGPSSVDLFGGTFILDDIFGVGRAPTIVRSALVPFGGRDYAVRRGVARLMGE